MSEDLGTPQRIPRRGFLSQLAASGAGLALLSRSALADGDALQALDIANPLSKYPHRDWEKVYRNLYQSDSRITFLCAPNDTHNCLLFGYLKNGVVTRIAPTYGYHQATDLDGNKASRRWDPRCCQKGLALVRRFYGDRRCKRPLVRKGFKDWLEAGFPRDPKTGAVDHKYLERGRDPWVTVTWDEALEMEAKALQNIAQTYSGDEGQQRLLAQGYDPLMVEATGKAGTQTLKFRGGMPALGMTRVFAQYRFANAMALLDTKIRGTDAETAVGGRGWDNYSWHTDLPPGHPMVTGQQTVDFDLCCTEHAGLILVWGMNWITTKMPDSHWLTEARLKGAHVVVIACEYSATANKADEVMVVRPGTTPALALGVAQILIAEKLYDAATLKAWTDLPLLVRMDSGKLLRASEVFPGYQLEELKNNIVVLKAGEKSPAIHREPGPVVTQARREEWGDYVIWDDAKNEPRALSRDKVGKGFEALGCEPRLDGTFQVKLADGSTVTCRTVFDVTRQMLNDSYAPETVSAITWAPIEGIRSLARRIAQNKTKTLFAMGMGPNQFFNNDLKDRAIFLVAALTNNVGHIGGNVGSYAGNYRASFFSGLGQYIAENPFDIEEDPTKPARSKQYWKAESVHYFNHGDQILRTPKAVLTGKTHMPVPTKSIHVSNSNSLIGNAKGHYDTIVNAFKKVEFIATNEWWWTASCEYSDIVFPVDSWAEFKFPDMTISVTNPFLYVFPATTLPRIHDTRSDVEVAAGVCNALGKLLNEPRLTTYWKFIHEKTARPYIQRILDHSNATRGYKIEDLEAKAAEGIPAILQTRTYPKFVGYEQMVENKPWYTQSGRLEFYREEPEFQDSGENLIVHREPIDATFYEPNVIVAKPHPLLRPKQPEEYGFERHNREGDARQTRHVILSVEELLKTEHPLTPQGFRYVFHTPKYRHGAHTTPVDLDIVAIWFGPFGDMHRSDPRIPFINEMYMDIHPADARQEGIEDGDYIWIDADPADRPFKKWWTNPEWYRVARLMVRARYYPGTPRGVTRMWHNMYGATYGSVLGARTNANGMARSPTTNYQSLFRSGSHQSCTRGWLKPTWMTDTLNVKGVMGQKMAKGFVADVHCPTGAPRESFVRLSLAEWGGMNGKRLWRPAALGLRPGYESETLKRFIAGGFLHQA